jgi:6,7-dimethyl-8-ribityllumazine synthase
LRGLTRIKTLFTTEAQRHGEKLIKSVQVGALVRSAQDLKLVGEFLSALGLRKEYEGENENCRAATFLPAKLKFDLVERKKPWADVDLSLITTDPDTVFQVIQKQGLKIISDHSGPEPTHVARTFVVEFRGGTRVMIVGTRVVESVLDTDHLGLEGKLDASGKHFGVVVSRFNSFITERLLAGALDGLVRCGAKLYEEIETVRVPGAFEIPSAARTLAGTKKYDAIICIGCLLRGDTAHYDVIVNEVTRGIGQSAQETGVPHAFGVLTCDTLEQAIDRAGLKMGNKGFEAALAAVEMASLKQAVGRQASGVRKKQVPRSARNGKVLSRNDKKNSTKKRR